MPSSYARLSVLCLALSSLVACSSKEAPSVSAGAVSLAPERLSTGEGSIQAATEGPLTATVRSIQEDQYKEPCDEKFRAAQFEIAAALDARAEAIAAFATASANAKPDASQPGKKTAPAYIPVRLGSTFVMEKSTPFKLSAESWVTSTNSWGEIVKFYEAMKTDPVNENWAGLNDWVRGVLVDDVNRVKNGTIFAFDETSGPAIEALRPAVEACWKDRACESIVLNAQQEAQLASQPYYAEIFRRVKEASTPEGRRRGISDLGMRLREDYQQFAFAKSPHVRAVSPGHYEVEIDAGPFAEAADQTRAYIENIWKAEGRAVKVIFKERSLVPDLFALKLEGGVGGRSYVDYANRNVVLFPGVRARAIAHEVGHVLGFPDVYFTIWDGEACVYGVRKNKQDLMSDPNYGTVLEAHWQKLAEKYPVK